MNGETAIRQHLTLLASSNAPARRRPALPCAATHLLTYGRSWEPAALPGGIRRGEPKACYQNAFRLATECPGRFLYAEGYALDPDYEIPMPHAWCVTEAGTVLDPTWADAERARYFGVAFDAVTTFRVHEATGSYGVLEHPNWRVAASILLGP
ncbi:hypothetical protein [Azospirillum agricola]|uniref:hypothetical protein n=1 Tax=Azospirillum agricola TaxID=1720247 RepID=UPI000A0F32C6|nr:hypothetical protein [Azospirillum agricola]SMH61431.1 hypothetical protein SAMN02982994_5827 [Azospirillum lipoferum]